MRTANICPTCAIFTNALCTLYDGPYLEIIDVSPLDDLATILYKINLYLGGTTTTTTTTSH